MEIIYLYTQLTCALLNLLNTNYTLPGFLFFQKIMFPCFYMQAFYISCMSLLWTTFLKETMAKHACTVSISCPLVPPTDLHANTVSCRDVAIGRRNYWALQVTWRLALLKVWDFQNILGDNALSVRCHLEAL